MTTLPCESSPASARSAVCSLLCAVATPALGDDIVAKKQQVDTQIDALQRPARRAAAERGGAAQPDRRRHLADPDARGAGRRRLAAALDARAGPRAAPRAAREAERSSSALQTKRLDAAQAAVRGRGRRASTGASSTIYESRPSRRRSTFVFGATLDRGRARQGRLHDADRRAGSADRRARSRTRSCAMQRARARRRGSCAGRSRARRT